MKNSGKPGKKNTNSPKTKNLDRGNQKPMKSQKIIKPAVRGR